jgi:hypothetical protein
MWTRFYPSPEVNCNSLPQVHTFVDRCSASGTVASEPDFSPTSKLEIGCGNLFLGLHRGPMFTTIITEIARRLPALDRYERRALSRRKLAIRAFDAGRSNLAEAVRRPGTAKRHTGD